MVDPQFRHLMQQRTLAAPVAFTGIGLHGGGHVTMRLRGASANSGITVIRTDLPAGERHFPLRPEYVVEARRGLTLRNSHGHTVMSLENVLSALYGLGLDNVHIELNGMEAPILDGSAHPIVAACLDVGITSLPAPRDLLVIRKPVRLQQGQAWAELRPDLTPAINVAISSADPDIGYQHLATDLTPGIYQRQIPQARNFGVVDQMGQLRARALPLVGNSGNAICLGGSGIAHRDGPRFGDEVVRRAALEALGVLSLAGATVIGEFDCFQFVPGLVSRLLALALSHAPSIGRIPATVLFSSSGRDDEERLAYPVGSDEV